MKEKPRYYATRVPALNPKITDPIWPGDPFWRSKKYPRELRARIAHEWHHDPSEPSLHAIASKYGVSISSLTCWCYAYPFGEREMTKRNYQRRNQFNHWMNQEYIDQSLNSYTKELRAHSVEAQPTWFLSGDPLPSRSALNLRKTSRPTTKISLPPINFR